jgi:methionyl aminopeptidase
MTAIYIKTEEEIEGFRRAGECAGKILRTIKAHSLPGWKPAELDEMAKEECEKWGAKPAFFGYRGFTSAICFSKGNIMVHGIPDQEPIRRDDLVSIDFGVDIDGFIGDTADTFVVSATSGQYGSIISECRFALWKATKAAKDGNKLSDISKEIKKVADAKNFLIPENYGGHGIDRGKMHASPFIPNQPDYENDFTLRKGMILAIEPMFIDSPSNKVRVAADGWSVIADGPAAHCEHTVLVGELEGIALTDTKGM